MTRPWGNGTEPLRQRGLLCKTPPILRMQKKVQGGPPYLCQVNCLTQRLFHLLLAGLWARLGLARPGLARPEMARGAQMAQPAMSTARAAQDICPHQHLSLEVLFLLLHFACQVFITLNTTTSFPEWFHTIVLFLPRPSSPVTTTKAHCKGRQFKTAFLAEDIKHLRKWRRTNGD